MVTINISTSHRRSHGDVDLLQAFPAGSLRKPTLRANDSGDMELFKGFY